MLNLLLLLLICLVHHSGTPPVGTSTIPVSGKKGGNVTLPCEYEAREISDISLNSLSENIPVCETEECSGRVFKQGNCDIIIKDLRLNDTGKYILLLYNNNDKAELERQIRTYQLQIHDEISVKIGEELKLDVLLPNAGKVEHQTRSKPGWKADWSRMNGVQSERLTINYGTLTINEFMASDAGTYRVVDFEGEILITVTVTESGTDSEGKQSNTNKEKTDDNEHHSCWILPVGLAVFLVVLLASILTAVTLRKRLHRGSTESVAIKDNRGNKGLSTEDLKRDSYRCLPRAHGT